MIEARLSPELPERYARLYDYRTGTFETPLDSQGIADIDALFELAIHTYPEKLPDFEHTRWDIHHVYFTKRDWEDYADTFPADDAWEVRNFRNSTPQLAYVPRVIHPWIETVMTPPPAPSLEIMRRRNAAWMSAKILLGNVDLLDKARKDYEEKKDDVRIVYGSFDGITPVSQQHDFITEERVNREYWLSELNHRLESWQNVSDIAHSIPDIGHIVIEPRLTSLRALSRRIRNGAIRPRMPELLAA